MSVWVKSEFEAEDDWPPGYVDGEVVPAGTWIPEFFCTMGPHRKRDHGRGAVAVRRSDGPEWKGHAACLRHLARVMTGP